MDSKKKTPAGETVDAALKGAIGGAITHAGDPYAAVLAAAGAVAGHVATKAVAFARASIQQRRSTDALLGIGSVVEFDERTPEIEAKLTRLIEAAGDDAGARARAVGSFEAMLEAWIRASRRAADDRKRRILIAALASGLDEESYREGLALSVIEALERLDYGAVRMLRDLHTFEEANDAASTNQYMRRELTDYFRDQLHDAKMLEARGARTTAFGRVALRFVHEELQNHMREEGEG